jgi:hypothetical protein
LIVLFYLFEGRVVGLLMPRHQVIDLAVNIPEFPVAIFIMEREIVIFGFVVANIEATRLQSIVAETVIKGRQISN